MDFQLNPELDVDKISQDYSSEQRVRIKELLPVEQAAHLSKCLAEQTSYRQAFVLGDKYGEASTQELNKLAEEERNRLLNGVTQQAANGVGFWYERSAIQANDEGLTGDFFKWLNSEAVLKTIAQISGAGEISGAVAEATRYKPGDFLTRHKNEIGKEKRQIAFAINLSPRWHPDWGGLLQFYQQDGTPRDTWSPDFNSLSLVDVSHIQSVTYVTPFAPEPRLAVSGWFELG